MYKFPQVLCNNLRTLKMYRAIIEKLKTKFVYKTTIFSQRVRHEQESYDTVKCV